MAWLGVLFRREDPDSVRAGDGCERSAIDALGAALWLQLQVHWA